MSSTITVYDRLTPYDFEGEKVTAVTWSVTEARTAGWTRWTDMTLYKVTGESERAYVVQIVARSVVYHGDKGCPRGVRVPVGLLGKDEDRYEALEACTKCSPPDVDDLSDDAVIMVEEDLPFMYAYDDAPSMVKGLIDRPKSGDLTIKMLTAAARVDSDVAEAVESQTKRRL